MFVHLILLPLTLGSSATYAPNDEVPLTVNVLSSLHKSAVPFDYYDSKFHFCKTSKPKSHSESLGSILFGDRMFSSDFKLFMLNNSTCNLLCKSTVPPSDAVFINDAISKQYLMKFLVDGLPASQHSSLEGRPIPGFLLGTSGDKLYLNNHYKLYLYYNPTENKIVNFEVNPSSTASNDCAFKEGDPGIVLSQHTVTSVQFTYDVYWIPSEIEWSKRWEKYLNSSEDKIHWFSLVNSVIVVFLLSAIVFGILVKALKTDITRYNETDLEDDLGEEFGWKVCHGDVFRPPVHRMFLSVFVGNGIQLLLMVTGTLVLAALGLLSPNNRGSLQTTMVVLYVIFGGFAGFVSARIYKMCGGLNWKQNVLWASFLIPGGIFMLLILINFVLVSQKSSAAVPFGTLFALLSLWLLLSAPLSLAGGYFGFKLRSIRVPVRTLQIPRQIPDQPFYLKFIPTAAISGVLPFGSLFIEMLYVMNSIWASRIYYVYGFLFVVFGVLILTTTLISVLVTYFGLCSENYHWWWRSFFSGAACGVYVFLYSIIYYMTKLEYEGIPSAIIYFGWNTAISIGLAIMLGTIGFLTSLLFVRRIFRAIKID